ncbi:hypothetical protein ACX80U_05730 [Arthrobacter sp. TmT3-37]
MTATAEQDHRQSQAMVPSTFEDICRRAWRKLDEAQPWDAIPEEARESYRADVRWILDTAADIMPIETLHGADGASVWLRGDQ